jgi:hypothetical protein
MKKIILAVILMAAAGGAVYYLLQKKKDHPVALQKELVTGKWKLDSLVAINDSVNKSNFALLLFAMDTVARIREYDFQPDGYILITNPLDTASKKDSSFYTWGNEGEIRWQEKAIDTASEVMRVIKLDRKEFVLRSSDSLLLYFRRSE